MGQIDGGELRRIREAERREDPKTFISWLNSELGRKYDLPRLSRWETGKEKVPDVVAVFLAGQRWKGQAAPERSARIFAVANHKGGVGKTTTAVNLAWGMVAAGMRVLVIDLDPQSDATLHLGLDREEVRESGLHMPAVLRGRCGIEEMLRQYDGTDLWIAPSSKDLTNAEKEVAASIGGEKRLAQRIEPLRAMFDAIVFDCGPNKNILTISALAMAEFLCIPVQAEFLAVQGMLHLLDTVTQVRECYNPGLTILPVLPTMYAARNSQDRATLEELNQLVGGLVPIFEAVPRATVFSQAAAAGHPALRAKPKAKAVAVYGVYVSSILSRLNPPTDTNRRKELAHG
jgi:chromosome partitioning protein